MCGDVSVIERAQNNDNGERVDWRNRKKAHTERTKEWEKECGKIYTHTHTGTRIHSRAVKKKKTQTKGKKWK